MNGFLQLEGSEQAALLVELTHGDLEFRLRAGENARVESYLGRYPLLTNDSGTGLELMQSEHRLRQRHEGAIDLDEYTRRFPAYIDELRRRLARAATLVDEKANLGMAAPELTACGNDGQATATTQNLASGRLVAMNIECRCKNLCGIFGRFNTRIGYPSCRRIGLHRRRMR